MARKSRDASGLSSGPDGGHMLLQGAMAVYHVHQAQNEPPERRKQRVGKAVASGLAGVAIWELIKWISRW